MPPRSSTGLPLDPHSRQVYGQSLRPPAGTVFAGGVATTYSLDFASALAIPATLAVYAAEDVGELQRNPMALLQGIERTSGQMAIFCQAGRIHARPKGESRLCSLLERIVVEARAPRGGEFHPKLWALRYRPKDPNGQGPPRLRLLVLSRNLTSDNSWDLCLCVDGERGAMDRNVNQPLTTFIRDLPQTAAGTLPDHVTSLTESLASDFSRAEWSIPPPFRSISFFVHGTGQRTWRPQKSSHLGVISPFLSAGTVEMLANLVPDRNALLVSRSEELDRIPQAVLDRYGSVWEMHEFAEAEEGEDIENPTAVGLHAKCYLQQIDTQTAVTMGSANASAAALQAGRNVEVLATLWGRTADVGTVEGILGPEGIGQVLVRYNRGQVTVDREQDEAEARLDDARREIAGASLALHCSSESPGAQGSSLWRMTLRSESPMQLRGIGSVEVWPVTRGSRHSRGAINALRSGTPVDLGAMALVDMSRFIAFSLRDESGNAEVRFALCLEMSGEPQERAAAALRWLVNSREAFLRYLRLLLADMSDPISAQAAARAAAKRAAGGDGTHHEPILEEMVHALCNGHERLQTVERLIHCLERDSDSSSDSVVPEKFLTLWTEFRQAFKKSRRSEPL